MYGSAQYTAALPDAEHPYARDNLRAYSKESVIGKDGRVGDVASFQRLGTSPLPGWDPDNGVEASFSFINACGHVVSWLRELKGSPHATRVSSARGRRVVFVTNIGAL